MRRRYKWRAEVDLFPFLSVLTCTLGILMTVTITLISGRIINVPEVWLNPGQMTHEPRLVIWDGTNVVVDQPEGQIVAPWSAVKENQENAFGKLLAEIRAQPDKLYLLIAVRPTGFTNFYDFFKFVEEFHINIGYWPIAQEKVVTLYGAQKGM